MFFKWGCFQLQWKPIRNGYLAQQLCLSESDCFLSLVANSQWGAKGRCCSTQSDMNGMELASPASQESVHACEEQPGPGRPVWQMMNPIRRTAPQTDKVKYSSQLQHNRGESRSYAWMETNYCCCSIPWYPGKIKTWGCEILSTPAYGVGSENSQSLWWHCPTAKSKLSHGLLICAFVIYSKLVFLRKRMSFIPSRLRGHLQGLKEMMRWYFPDASHYAQHIVSAHKSLGKGGCWQMSLRGGKVALFLGTLWLSCYGQRKIPEVEWSQSN